MALYFPAVHFFSSAANEVILGIDALRVFNAKLPASVKVENGAHTATEITPDVVICSGYYTVITANARIVTRLSLVLANVNGTWLITVQHNSALPRPS